MDQNKLRKIAGLPLLTERQLVQLEEGKKKKEVEAAVAPVEGATEDELPKIISKVAKKAEGKTGDDLIALIKQVYDAGVKDGMTQAKEEVATPQGE